MALERLLAGLLYDLNYVEFVPETKHGVPIYAGLPGQFDNWVWEVELKGDAIALDVDVPTREQQLTEFSSRLTEGLSGEAQRIAMDLGKEKLLAIDGAAQLITAMRARVKTEREEDVRAL